MRVDFVRAADGTPITKRFVATPSGIDVHPYPMVKLFDSTSVVVRSIEELHTQLLVHAADGAALMKGRLVAQLDGQSRAGMTIPHEPTVWLCKDFDFSEGFASVDDALAAIDPALADVSYIFQHSASAGITNPVGLRGHVLVMIKTPAAPAVIKEWLTLKNLTNPILRDMTVLSANGLTLKYPLDVTTCQNDKPLFIAEPMVEGLTDPLAGQRTQLVVKGNPIADIDFQPHLLSSVSELVRARVAELRKEKGLRTKNKQNYKTIANQQVLTNPDPAIVSGIKEARGYVYLNLNGGDSWAYYFPLDNPNILNNFKGEPPVLLKDIAPETYAHYKNAGKSGETPSASSEVVPFVVHDAETDQYHTVLHNETTNEVLLGTVSNLTKLQHFMVQRGHESPEVIPDWNLVFDPTTFDRIRKADRWINTFVPTRYMLADYPITVDIPPIIERILDSLLSEPEIKAYFLNWLAFIFQTREKAQTGWIFSGTTGTGKGLLYLKILKPLFGDLYVKPVLSENLEEQFNAYAVDALFNIFDETNQGNRGTSERAVDRLKNLVTEEMMPIRLMRANPTQRRVYNNIIINTNRDDPIPLAPDDRRFNVAPPQTVSLAITDEEVDQIEAELDQFAAFLASYEVGIAKVRKPLKTEHTANMIKAAANTVDAFFAAFNNGDIDYLLDLLDGPMRHDQKGVPDIGYKRAYDIIQRWASSPNREQAIPRDEIETVYVMLMGKPTTPAKFSRICRIHKLEIKPVRYEGEIRRGTTVVFKRSAYEAHRNVEPSKQITILRPQAKINTA